MNKHKGLDFYFILPLVRRRCRPPLLGTTPSSPEKLHPPLTFINVVPRPSAHPNYDRGTVYLNNTSCLLDKPAQNFLKNATRKTSVNPPAHPPRPHPPPAADPLSHRVVSANYSGVVSSEILPIHVIKNLTTNLLLGQFYYGVHEAVIRGGLCRHEVIAVQVLVDTQHSGRLERGFTQRRVVSTTMTKGDWGGGGYARERGVDDDNDGRAIGNGGGEGGSVNWR